MAEALAYFDTSVLIKRYVEDPGSAHARRLMRRYRLLSSVIAPVEAVSAIARRYRAGEVTRTDFDTIVARMNADRSYWELVELGSGVLEGAERLILQTPVRTLDALHIASALVLQMESGAPLPFATADARQREAADRAGLKVVWVT
ncbi:MAG: type II toxin-antitoxin system VapC family toxin [Candidatus Binataceae bacterium]|jgi:predicted nucleic acid-binding protein